MSSSSPSVACVVCGRALSVAGQACPDCHASADWQDLIAAVQFVQRRFEQWEKERAIGREQLATITRACSEYRQALNLSARECRPLPSIGLLPRDRCWNCNGQLGDSTLHCPVCGVPAAGPQVEQLRYWNYACIAIKSYYDSRWLSLAQAHGRINEAKGRIASLRADLERQRCPMGKPAPAGEPEEFAAAVADLLGAEEGDAFCSARFSGSRGADLAQPAKAGTTKRPLWEILLDPRSIQWLLGLGGALLVLGLVIWLAAIGIFQNALVVAVALGLGNAALLVAGWLVTTYSRYETAGRALTLLACLVMPLNLYFYHHNQLITLDGHLWVAALVCCVLYAASALTLRDPMFVYVLCGGVAMTGLLLLADGSINKFWEIAAPSTMLVVMGLTALHVERAFPEADGPFSRRRFGLAFFWSGQTLLAAGLLLLLGAQITGDWLYKPFFHQFYERWNGDYGPPAVVQEHWGQLLALALALAGTYAYAYSDLVVRRVGVYIYLAVFTLLWAEVLVIELFAVGVTAEAAIIALALTALTANLLASASFASSSRLRLRTGCEAASGSPLNRAGPPLGLLLSTLPVLLGVLLHLRATYKPLHDAWLLPNGELYTIGWWYVGAMALTAVACRIGAHLYRYSAQWLSAVYFFGTAAATLVGAAGLLSMFGAKTWEELAPILMIIPILYLIAARLYRGHTGKKGTVPICAQHPPGRSGKWGLSPFSPEDPLVWTAQAATGVILAAVLAAWAGFTPEHVFTPAIGKPLNLSLAIVFAEAAAFYTLAAGFRRQGINVYLATAAASGAIWQLLQYREVGAEYYTLAFAVAGLVLLVGYRLAVWEWTGLAEPAFQCANALMSLSFVAAALLTLSRLATRPNELHWPLVLLLAGLTAFSLLAAWLVRHPGWRRWYVVMAITEAALMFLTVYQISQLTLWQKLEVFSLAVGAALLVVGHMGWYREQERHDDLVTFSLFMGSLLVAAPLTIAVLIYRGEPHFSPLDELGMLAAGIVLLATGFMFQIRSTTLSGATLLVTYLVTLVLYINMLQNVKTAAIWMTIGGGVIFGTGVLLSIYRDRLLTLPDQVKRREGIFRVLGWR